MKDCYLINGEVFIDHVFQKKIVKISRGRLEILEEGASIPPKAIFMTLKETESFPALLMYILMVR